MNRSDFFKPLHEHKNSCIIDISQKSVHTYEGFYRQVELINKELCNMEITKKSIVVIYKINNTFNTLLLFLACLKNDLIPFIVENEEIEDLSDIKYRVIITNNILTNKSITPVKLRTLPEIFMYELADPDYYIGKENDFIIVTSSKSTSLIPKKILLGEKQTMFNIISNKESLPITKNDKTLILLPLSYSYGLIAQFFTHLFVGADILIAPKIIGVMQLKYILENYHITNIFLTPLLARLILVYNNKSIKNALHFITLGGDKPSISTIKGINELLNCTIYGTYGLAEAGPRVATLEIDPKSNNIDLGKINNGIDATIVENEKYKYLTKHDSIGYLKISTSSVYLGYIQGKQLCKPESQDFIQTKDIVYKTDGKLFLLGRENEYKEVNSKLYWFQDFKSFFYNNTNVLKVKIHKGENEKLSIVIYYKNTKDQKFAMEDSFQDYFGLEKEKDYNLKIVDYQYNQYK